MIEDTDGIGATETYRPDCEPFPKVIRRPYVVVIGRRLEMSRSMWREALDGRTKLIRSLRNPEGRRYLRVMASGNSRYEDTIARSLMALIHQAELFAWNEDQTEFVLQDIDRDRVSWAEKSSFRSGDLPCKTGLYWLNSPLVISAEHLSGQNEGTKVRAILWGCYQAGDPLTDPRTLRTDKTRQGATLAVFAETERGFAAYPAPVIDDGWSVVQAVENSREVGWSESVQELYRASVETCAFTFLMASSLFLKTHLEVEAPLLDRAIRRQMRREDMETPIRVVNWRKVEYKYPEGHEPQPVDWSCHWSVRSHKRTYKRTGKTIIVPSYIKGNLQAPYKLPAKEIVNVVRQ